MSLFKYNNHLTTCKQSVMKLILAIFLIALLINRSHFLGHIDDKVIRELINLLSGIIAVVCIYTIYISIIEICDVFEKRHSEKLKNLGVPYYESKSYSFNKIIKALEREDIMDFVIKVDDSGIKIGVSSDCNSFGGKLFDKRYYIGETEYVNITEFREALSKVNRNANTIEVISIDDDDPKWYNI